MRYLLVFMLLVAVFVLGKRSCTGPFGGFSTGVHASGPTKTESRDVRDFHAISLEASGEVEVTVADQFSVEVTAQENILPLLKTVVENGRLRIFFDEDVSNVRELKIRVSGPAFDGFDLSGSGKIAVVTPLKADRLAINVSGSGELVLLQTEAREVTCDISGSGTVELGGTANQLDAQISGSGDVKAKGLTTAICNATIGGSGTVTCDVSQTLKADIGGSGDVYYTGAPTVEANVSGSGSVKKI